ncbi:RHS repeat protein [Streptomyces inusitatus]|nr:RHS repeat protein [Streptomyces inusitatus]
MAAVPKTPAAPKKAAATQAADISSARVAARLSGKRVEALSERTETSTTWVNKDGSLTTDLSAGPVRFKDRASGEWQDVDLDLVRAAGGAVESKAHPRGLALAGKTGTPARSLAATRTAKATDLVTLGEGDQRITLQWKGGLPAPTLTGTRAEYVNAVPGADVVVEATRTGFEQYVEIKQRPATAGYTYTLPLKAEGLKAKQLADGSVRFTDRKNKVRAVMPAPVMWDATVDPLSGEHTRRVPVAMKAVKTKGGVDLVITPDAKFLADPKTKYPVTVDPSTSALGNVFDTYVQQGETVDWSGDTELDLGNPGTTNPNGTARTARSFISWDTTPIRDALITNATLSLWNFHSGNATCVAQPWEVWSAGAATTSSRWTAQPAWTAKRATSTETRGRPVCTGAPDGWINADVGTLVQEWTSAQATRGHLGLRATSETDTAQWKRVNSANAASNPPKLTVSYNYRPRTGTMQEAGPPYFSHGGDYTVNTLRPVLRDSFVDADGDKVNSTFQIFDSVTDTQVGALRVSPYVPSGAVASITVAAGVLTNGRTYKFRTNPSDGAHYNLAWSPWRTFTVDTSAPSAPTGITSTDYPPTAWVKGAGQTGVFTVTPPAADHNWLEWSLDGVTWTKVTTDGTGGARNIGIAPPKDGTHTLQVRAVDKADNKSEPVEYTFHAGPGGFIQPTDGERTAHRLPLVAEADATAYDSVSFYWRRSAADLWRPIPAGDVTSAGTPLTGWPVALTAGKNAPLVWKTTDTVNLDGTVQLKADFTGAGSAAGSTQSLTVVVDRNATDAAADQVGPGSVNLITGDYTLSANDTSEFGLSTSRTASSREPDKGATQAGQAPIFGEEWVSGTVAELTESAYSHIRKISDTAVAVVGSDGSETYFTANAASNGWIPEPGSEHLTLQGSTTGSFTLSNTDGTVNVFTKPDPTVPTWQVSSTLRNGLTNSTTTVVSETTSHNGLPVARPKWIIAPTSAVTAAECAANPAAKGCRVLEFQYPTTTTAIDGVLGDMVGRVKAIRLWATEPGAATSTALNVASYAYDSAGRLRETWNPRISPALKTAYAYDAAGRVTQLTPPGELPWTFTYGTAGGASTAGAGMLLKASRSGLQQGTADVEQGTATISVVYGVPLTGVNAPYAMGTADVRTWGQTDTPTDATALFPADSVPASHTGGSLTATDYARAEVHYLDVSGREVNSAAPGGHISTTEHDRFGNTISKLSPGNRAVALGLTPRDQATQAELGIAQLSTTGRAELLTTRSVYDQSGTRETDRFGPLRRIDLTADLKSGTTTLVPSGTSVTARPWTVNEYDGGRPTDGTAVIKDQVTKAVAGAEVRGYPGLRGEGHTTQTVYDWAKGLAVQAVKDPGDLAITEATEYDAQGRIVKQLLPGAGGTDAATRATAYWSATGTGTCRGRPEWADLICSTGPAGTITGGGAHPDQLPTTTSEYDWYGNTAKTTETANGVTRTTTTAYDDAGRRTAVVISGGVGDTPPTTAYEYATSGGQVARITSPTGGTITKAYDRLGRVISYTDADGGVTTTEYDLLDRRVRVADSVPSAVTYTYDHTAEPRGLVTRSTDSVAGHFQATYDSDGSVLTEKLPGGYTLTRREDTADSPVELVYTRDSDGTTVYSDTVTRSVHGQITTHSGWSNQDYRYDATGRLTTVEDTVDTVCTRRGYAFDARSNRTSLAKATGTPGADCPAGAGTSTTHAYDSADRVADAGYAYDALGRSTTVPGNGTIEYYANDLVRRQTVNGERQTWQLDAQQRFRSWTSETGSGSAWTQTASKRNHYDSDGDNPRWIVEDTANGALSRNVDSTTGELGAVTDKTGQVTLQLANVHGDISLLLPLDAAQAPLALDSDEYGNMRSSPVATRYDWLGAKQRSTETLTGVALMGVRLYNPTTGRFLSADPVYGGNANSYIYPADPVNMYDLTGMYSVSRSWYKISVTLSKRENEAVMSGGGYAAAFLGGIKKMGFWGRIAYHAFLGFGTLAWLASRQGKCLRVTVSFMRPYPSFAKCAKR